MSFLIWPKRQIKFETTYHMNHRKPSRRVLWSNIDLARPLATKSTSILMSTQQGRSPKTPSTYIHLRKKFTNRYRHAIRLRVSIQAQHIQDLMYWATMTSLTLTTLPCSRHRPSWARDQDSSKTTLTLTKTLSSCSPVYTRSENCRELPDEQNLFNSFCIIPPSSATSKYWTF